MLVSKVLTKTDPAFSVDEGAEFIYTNEWLSTYCQNASSKEQREVVFSIALQLVSYKLWLVELLSELAEILATQQLNPVAKLVPAPDPLSPIFFQFLPGYFKA